MILNIRHRDKPVKGLISLPGDKSIAQRAIILAAIAEGKSVLRNVPLSDDCLSVIRCVRQLGVEVEIASSVRTRNDNKAKAPLAMTGIVIIKGRGLYGLKKPFKPLNVGESGTAARLLAGLLAGQSFASVITGKKTLLSRPMKRVIEPLKKMGAKIESKGGRLPLRIFPTQLKGIKYAMPVASAQVKSAILLAGLYADGQTVIKGPIPTRDHTERLLNTFTTKALRTQRGKITLRLCGASLMPIDMEIPGDFSSAAYFIAAGLLIPGSEITIKNVGLNPHRIGLLQVLRKMGARVSQISNLKSQISNAEPVGHITVKYSQLKGVTVPKGIIPSLIDEIPILALIATQAKGTTIIKGAGELRVKETDRIKAIVTELAKLGADISEIADPVRVAASKRIKIKQESISQTMDDSNGASGMIIKGPTRLHGATCSSHNDHRMAMTLAIAGLIVRHGGSASGMTDGKTRIKGAEVINKSFPSFRNYNIITENTNTNHTNGTNHTNNSNSSYSPHS